MKKSVIAFVKNGRKFNIRKKVTEVQSFDSEFHSESRVDKYGRVVHNMRWSESHYAMSKDDWREETKTAMIDPDQFSGIYASGTVADPSIIVEFAHDNGYELGQSFDEEEMA